MDTTHSTAACSKCKQCGRILTKDEIGLHKKLYNRGASSYFCIDCSSQYLEVPVPLLQKKIEEFKGMHAVSLSHRDRSGGSISVPSGSTPQYETYQLK